MHALEVKNLSHWYGKNRILNKINLQIAYGQVVALVGPSGCGKSTLLRAILGTDPPSEGEVLAEGKRVTEPSRDVGIVYQHYSLYDFLSAEENVAFGLKLDKTSLPSRFIGLPTYLRKRREHLQMAREFLTRVGLEAAAGHYPSELSGGMRQRVAIAQAFILKPKLVLLDEPFGALDEATREDLQMMLLGFYQENLKAKQRGEQPQYTIIIVTHELNEALYVADRVIGLSRFHTEGSQGAMVVYDRPCPVLKPDASKDLSRLVEQREELRSAVFDPSNVKHHSKYVSFWDDLARDAQAAEAKQASNR
ncbi:MAG: ATP-binding cassette domain-containing protein [Planctomycetota bacterium]|nr:ATP-binding cassette domain-containing protein [Planctomycetota bacterium]